MAPDLDAAADLKSDASAADGIGSEIKNLHELGSANFKKVWTGKTESSTLTVDDDLQQRITEGGKRLFQGPPSCSRKAKISAQYLLIVGQRRKPSTRSGTPAPLVASCLFSVGRGLRARRPLARMLFSVRNAQ